MKLSCIKSVFLLLLTTIFFSSCQNTSVNSQTTPSKNTQNKMDKTLKSLEDLQWKNRIILVRENEDKSLQQLTNAKDKITERDIIWFVVDEGNIETNYQGELPKDFAAYLNKDYFDKLDSNVFLIGKDGTVKSKDEKFDLNNYFEQIDSMPMRQREMKRN